MIVIGAAWRGAPRWARLTLITIAALFIIYFLITIPL
jgi:hypothetical protein